MISWLNKYSESEIEEREKEVWKECDISEETINLDDLSFMLAPSIFSNNEIWILEVLKRLSNIFSTENNLIYNPISSEKQVNDGQTELTTSYKYRYNDFSVIKVDNKLMLDAKTRIYSLKETILTDRRTNLGEDFILNLNFVFDEYERVEDVIVSIEIGDYTKNSTKLVYSEAFNSLFVNKVSMGVNSVYVYVDNLISLNKVTDIKPFNVKKIDLNDYSIDFLGKLQVSDINNSKYLGLFESTNITSAEMKTSFDGIFVKYLVEKYFELFNIHIKTMYEIPLKVCTKYNLLEKNTYKNILSIKRKDFSLVKILEKVYEQDNR